MVPLWLKAGFTLWVLVWAPLYAFYPPYGPAAFLWFCDIGNFMIALALWRGSRVLFSWQAVSVLAVQIVWTLDLTIGLAFGTFPFHAAGYMVDAQSPLYIRLLSLFHVAHVVILIWALKKFGYDRRGWLLQSATALVILPISWLIGPDKNLNWTWKPFDQPQAAVAPWVYLLICMVAYPILLYGPTHLALRRISPRTGDRSSAR